MAFSKTVEGRRDQLVSSGRFTEASLKYGNLSDAVKNIWHPENLWGPKVAECIKFPNLNFWTSGKLKQKTYSAFEPEAKLVIAILRSLQAGKTRSPPEAGNAETVQPYILQFFNIASNVNPLPRGGSASNLSKWLSQVGIKDGDEKEKEKATLTVIANTINTHIENFLEANADDFADTLSRLVKKYKKKKAANILDMKFKGLQAEIKGVRDHVDKAFETLNERLDKHRDQLAAAIDNTLKRVTNLKADVTHINENFLLVQKQVEDMRDEITANCNNEIDRVSREFSRRQDATNRALDAVPEQVDKIWKRVDADAAACYAKIYALSLSQRLQADLSELLYTANYLCCEVAQAVGMGFDQYQKHVHDEPNSGPYEIAMSGIKYICKKIPLVGGIVEVIEDGAGAVKKIIGEGNPAAEAEYDTLATVREKRITAENRGAIERLKAWVKKCKTNKQTEGVYITVGLKALSGVSRHALGYQMRKVIHEQSEKFLVEYNKQISALLDADFVLEEVDQQNLVLGTDGAQAKETGKKFIESMVADFSPLDSGNRSLGEHRNLLNANHIGSMIELYLYGVLRGQSANQPGQQWRDATLSRLGTTFDQESYGLFQKREPDNDAGDIKTLGRDAKKIPLMKGGSPDNRYAIAHAVLVALQKKIDANNWEAVFSFQGNSDQKIEKILGDGVEAAMKKWFGHDLKKKVGGDPKKRENIDDYIREISQRIML